MPFEGEIQDSMADFSQYSLQMLYDFSEKKITEPRNFITISSSSELFLKACRKKTCIKREEKREKIGILNRITQ